MTTKHSPISKIKEQADVIARSLKGFERGEVIDVRFADQLKAARDKPALKFGIMMDDKLISIEIPWTLIADSTELALSEFIVKKMKEIRDV